MVDAGFDDGDRVFVSGDQGLRFFEAPFLRHILNDLMLALDLGRPVFLLGAPGSGKSALADQAARSLGDRYGIARLPGQRLLDFEDVVEVCRWGFTPDAWVDLAAPRERDGHDPGRPGTNVLIVDQADLIAPRLIEQMIAMSNGSPDLMPSHRILLVGRDGLADVIETGHVRNNWGVPLVLSTAPWPAPAVAPFLRHRLRSGGIGDHGLLSDATIATIALEAAGNPGRMLERAQRILYPDGVEPPIDDPVEPPPISERVATIIDLEPLMSFVEAPAAIRLVDPPPMVAPALTQIDGMSIHRLAAPRRILHLTLPVAVVLAAALAIWATDQPPPRPMPPALLAAAPSAPQPVPSLPAAVAPPPTPVAVVPPPAPVVAEADPPPIEVESFIARGDALLADGDFAAARLFYLQAARAGSARAATAVGRTYDPVALDRLGVVGERGEPAKAADWYRKAIDLGDPAAAEPLRRLTAP